MLLRASEQRVFWGVGEISDKYIYIYTDKNIFDEHVSDQIGVAEKYGSTQTLKEIRDEKKILVVVVQFWNANGAESTRFWYFDPTTIRMKHNKPASRVDSPMFELATYFENIQYFYVIKINIDNIKFKYIGGWGFIDSVIYKIPPLSARFFLTVAVDSLDNIKYKWLDRYYLFDIIPKSANVGLPRSRISINIIIHRLYNGENIWRTFS